MHIDHMRLTCTTDDGYGGFICGTAQDHKLFNVMTHRAHGWHSKLYHRDSVTLTQDAYKNAGVNLLKELDLTLVGKHYHYKKRNGEWESVRIVDEVNGRLQIRVLWKDKRDYLRLGRARWVNYTPKLHAAIADWPWFPGMKPKAAQS